MDYKNINVLIADDDEVVRETLKESLFAMGFNRISTAGDGQESLEALDGGEIELLLLDLAMPRVRGEEVVELAVARNPDLVIIVITGFATLDKAVDLMRKGIHDLLRKPFNYSMLARKIEGALAKREARREAAKDPENSRRQFGDFELVEEISRGGAGVVWKAREKSSGEMVAMKVLLAGEQATDEQVLRFHREASTIAQLRHPNIVSIRRIGAFRGRHFIAMDFIDGLPLDEWIERRNPAAREIVNGIVLAGRAIHYAHMREIMHRDIKPSNILVDANSQPHLIDFGLAKSIRDNLRITRKYRLHGTIGYMAPERFRESGAEGDVRSDVFSLGVILYETLSGHLPYRMVYHGHYFPDFTRAPDPVPQKPGLCADVSTIALKAVALKPDDRYQSALEFVEALEKCLQRR